MCRFIVLLIICTIPSAGFAAKHWPMTKIAVEYQENGKFTHIIGSALLDDEGSIELVTFVGGVDPYAYTMTILEKHSRIEGFYTVQCVNQMGVGFIGTIDIRDPLKPLIRLTTDNGVTITNISDGGKKMKNEFLPKVNLGH